MDFSENIAANDLKVSRSRHLIAYMKVCEYWRSRLFLDLGPRLCKYKNWNPIFLRNYCANLNQISYERFQVQGNDNLMTWWPWSDLELFYGKVKFGNLCFSKGKSENSGFFRDYSSLWPESWYMQTTNWVYEGMWVLKVKVISLPYIFQVLYVLCFTRPR